MRGGVARRERPAAADDLFVRVGAFLREHGLSPDPAHYSFAWHVLSEPQGAVAQAVARITEDGVRLRRADIESLGGSVKLGGPSEAPQGERLVGEAWTQVEEFARMMRDIHDQTRGFGRDLAEHAAEMERSESVADLARITGAMLARVHEAEHRLEHAARETDELRAKLEEARATARVDPLTGLPNRRAFEEAFAARRSPSFLALCDVDRFKRINDGFGHEVGDRVLSAIADSLRVACAGHVVARQGGEEFVVLITGGGLDAACALMEQARESLATKRFRSRETDALIGRVTMSVGLTAVPAGETLEDAFARADHQLYAAKAAGRDKLCSG
jgi:diguanylate cyclase